MGRREKPLDARREDPLAELARWLRAQRRLRGLTYTVLAGRTGYHATTLQRAADGHHMPTWPVVQAYATACGASVPTAARRWRTAHTGRPVTVSDTRPRRVHDADDLVSAMIQLRRRAGQPSLREIERMTAGPGRLPRATLQRILAKRTLPTRDQLTAFLRACGVRETSLRDWGSAWERASTPSRVTRSARLFRRDASPEDLLRRLAEVRARNLTWPERRAPSP